MPDKDQSGREQLGRNVLTSWISYFVFIIFGFIMPRAIHESIGQVGLGIWDFAWAIVSYLNLAMIGIGSSVNRHVARYRASRDFQSLSSTISSVTAIQIAIAGTVFAIVCIISNLIPSMLKNQLGDQVDTAATIVFYLGASLSVQMAFDSFRGVLTGCHRWTTHNALNAGSYAISATGMLITLMNGGGLEGMAIVYFVVTVLAELFRVRLARAVCPEVRYDWRLVNKRDILKMVRFGLKAVLLYMPRMVILQTVNLFVVANLGVAVLAILARPVALVAHIATLINKFAFVLTPTAGSLQGSGQSAELKEFALTAMRAGWIFTLLPTTYLLVLGDRVIDLWMGPGYANLEIIVILAVGSILPSSQRALITIMIGMNRHGRIAKYGLALSAITILCGLVVVEQFSWSLTSAAWLIATTSTVGVGLVALLVGCNVLQISASQYVKEILRDPLVLFVVSSSALLIVRFFGPQTALASIVVGALIHGLVSGILLRKDIQIAFKMLAKKTESKK